MKKNEFVVVDADPVCANVVASALKEQSQDTGVVTARIHQALGVIAGNADARLIILNGARACAELLPVLSSEDVGFQMPVLALRRRSDLGTLRWWLQRMAGRQPIVTYR